MDLDLTRLQQEVSGEQAVRDGAVRIIRAFKAGYLELKAVLEGQESAEEKILAAQAQIDAMAAAIDANEGALADAVSENTELADQIEQGQGDQGDQGGQTP